jgi:hypothetical protein
MAGDEVSKGILHGLAVEGAGEAKGYRLIVRAVGIFAAEAAGDPYLLLGFDCWQYPNDLGTGEWVKFYRS